MKRAAAVVLSLLLVASQALAGGDPGREVFYGASPSCAACHNERRGNLAHSRASVAEIRYVVNNGIPQQMPAYRFSDAQMNALIDFLLSLRAGAAK